MESKTVFVDVGLEEFSDEELKEELCSRGFTINAPLPMTPEKEEWLGYRFIKVWERDLLDFRDAALGEDIDHLKVVINRLGIDA